MNRETKFRAIDLFSDFIYGQAFYIDKINNQGYIANGIDDYHPVKSETVGQFTGLKDKNGVEIYEGDIMQHANPFDIPFEVNWIYTDCCFGFNNGCTSYNLSDPSFEVIGNIYENPELLK